jgi:maltooligosyltrehalose trehalohydrolase
MATQPRHGAWLNNDNTAQFSLWAPDAQRVAVKMHNQLFPLQAQEHGWFSGTIECTSGATYCFVINDELEVPDPASRAQVEDVNGLSRVVNPAYPWKTQNWKGFPWHQCIIYEAHVGAVGGFNKLNDLIPHLVELGVNVIELMPICECFGNRNWGYDGVLLFAPQSSYGSPEEFKNFIDNAHANNIMVFIDVVYNHFGLDGYKIKEYAKSFFRTDITNTWGNAIDFRQQAVRDFFYENALMWILDYRIDGLRLDAVQAITDNEFPILLAERLKNAVPPDRQVHIIVENANNSARLLENGIAAQWNDDAHHVLHHLLTGENEWYYADYCQNPTENLARCLREGFVYQGQATPKGKKKGEPSGHLPSTAFVLYLQNHDQIGNRPFGDRLTQLVDINALKAATVLKLLSPMIPLTFMGEEYGSTQPFLFFVDYDEELAAAVRKGRLEEFSELSALKDPALQEKIPDPNSPDTFNRSKINYADYQAPEHQQWFDFYKKLIHVRRQEIIPYLTQAKSTNVVVLAEKALLAEWQLGEDRQLIIFLNLSADEVPIKSQWETGDILFSHNISPVDLARNILPSNSALALKCRSIRE